MSAKDKTARLVDVAERAGVSKATASNVFNRPGMVRDEVRARVLAAAEAIGYAGPRPARADAAAAAGSTPSASPPPSRFPISSTIPSPA